MMVGGASNEFDLQGLPPKAGCEGRRPARRASNEFDLKRPSASGRPALAERWFSCRRRPASGAQVPSKTDFNQCADRRPARKHLARPISNRRTSPRPARRASNEFDRIGLRPASGLRWPGVFPSAEADGRRVAPHEADFNRRDRPPAGLRRPKGGFHAGEGRHPARKRLRRPISIGAQAHARRASASQGRFPIGAKRR